MDEHWVEASSFLLEIIQAHSLLSQAISGRASVPAFSLSAPPETIATIFPTNPELRVRNRTIGTISPKGKHCGTAPSLTCAECPRSLWDRWKEMMRETGRDGLTNPG